MTEVKKKGARTKSKKNKTKTKNISALVAKKTRVKIIFCENLRETKQGN
jgi:hypothetical protein